ncbi:hypothetical protein SAZ11_42835 [Streptomyces sp. FXJ1.4098]|nr:hypothetical protein [Streptomyces sp. FXJ1.4098]
MSTGTLSRPGLARLSPRGPLWLAWRRQRTALLLGGVLILAVAGYIAHQRTGMVDLIRDRNLAGCRLWYPECHGMRLSSDDGRPTPLGRAFGELDSYRTALLYTGRLLLAIPALIGTFIGAPLVARELESGTAKVVWSQSAGRTRWLPATLAVPAAATLAATSLLAALFTWWWWPVRGMVFDEVSWVTTVPFEVAGPAPWRCPCCPWSSARPSACCCGGPYPPWPAPSPSPSAPCTAFASCAPIWCLRSPRP